MKLQRWYFYLRLPKALFFLIVWLPSIVRSRSRSWVYQPFNILINLFGWRNIFNRIDAHLPMVVLYCERIYLYKLFHKGFNFLFNSLVHFFLFQTFSEIIYYMFHVLLNWPIHISFQSFTLLFLIILFHSQTFCVCVLQLFESRDQILIDFLKAIRFQPQFLYDTPKLLILVSLRLYAFR